MAMTAFERECKDYLMRKLRSQGYGTYAKLLNLYHLNVTHNPRVAGYMDPKEGTIVVNADLDEDQVALIIRHEIMHFYLEHATRIFKKLASLKGLNPDDIDDMTAEELNKEIYGDPEQTANWAADFDISNQAYTDADKAIIRAMGALVTEDHHSDWVDLTLEEMYEKLRTERANKQVIIYGGMIDSTTFVGSNGVVYGI